MNHKLNSRLISYIGVIWAIFGLTLIFVPAIFRIIPYATEALKFGLSLHQWILLIIWCIFMLFTEGYRGFQKQFSPRVASRTLFLLKGKPRFVDILLAPLFCMGFFHATKRVIIANWSIASGVTLLVIIVRHFSQPWRGIIDMGVALGLSYGLITIYYFLYLALKTRKPVVDPELG